MAVVRFPDEGRTVTGEAAVREALGRVGIDYERWQPSHPIPDGAPAEAVLAAYATEIDRLKKAGGYVTADVIDVSPQTPNLDTMLAKFRREHWHDEDEVRFILRGSTSARSATSAPSASSRTPPDGRRATRTPAWKPATSRSAWGRRTYP